MEYRVRNKLNIIFVFLSLLLVTGIAALVISHILHAKKETGYPSGTVQTESLYYNGGLFFYFAGDADHPNELPLGYRKIGEVGNIDNDHLPKANLDAARLKTGMSVYAKESGEPDHLYVFIDDAAVFHRLLPKQ